MPSARQELVCDREALKRAGFPVHLPLFCGWNWYLPPNAEDIPRNWKKKPDWMFKGWRTLAEVRGPRVGFNIRDRRAGILCSDFDYKHGGKPDPKFHIPILKASGCVERSVSNMGYHAFFTSSTIVPADQWRHPEVPGMLEVYGYKGEGAKARFIALTGHFTKDRAELRDALDEPDALGLIAAIGWTPSDARPDGGVYVLPASLPKPPLVSSDLVEWAELIDGSEHDPAGQDFGRFGRFKDRSSARFAWLCKAALACSAQDELAALMAQHFPSFLGHRANAETTIEGEVANTWAERPSMPPAGPIGRDYTADFGAVAAVVAPPIAPNISDQNDGDIGENAEQIAGVTLSIPDEQLARDMMAHFEERNSGIMHAPGLGKSYFLEPPSGLWLPDMDGKFEREIYTYNRTRAETWLNENPELSSRVARSIRNDYGSTGRMSRVRTALQAYAGVSHDKLDSNPLLVGMVDGVYDIEADRLRPARLDEYVTMTTEVAPDPRMDTPVFRAFMESVFRHDPELIGFMQRWIGYCLTGLTTEQKIVFAWGKGQNGKSTFFEIIKEMLGTYAKKIAAEALMQRKQDAHASEIAQLMGKRFVLATEISETAAWNEGRLKELSGGDTINANFMRQDKIEFPMYGKVNIAGNHKPRMNGTDFAMIRRMCLVPFIQSFEGRQMDPDMKDKLRAEKRGILWWAVQGARVWRRNGLQVPSSVLEASSDYFKQEDMVAEWLKNYCEPGPDFKIPIRDVTKSLNMFMVGIGRNRHYSPIQAREELQAKGYMVQEGKARMHFLFGFKLARDTENYPNAAAESPDYGEG